MQHIEENNGHEGDNIRLNGFIQKIRSGTKRAHQSAEQEIPWASYFQSRWHYTVLLSRLKFIVCEIDWICSAQLEASPRYWDQRRTAAWLADDLSYLPSARVDVAGSLPSSRLADSVHFSEHSAMGVAYVHEGSALGASYLAKYAWDALGINANNGGRYFAAYGSSTGTYWKQFLHWMGQRLTEPGHADTALDAAVKTFDYYCTVLSAPINDIPTVVAGPLP